MPGARPDPRRALPVDPEWHVEVWCPHGHKIRAPLDDIRAMRPLVDPCPIALQEREDAESERIAASRFLQWREARRMRRALREPYDWLTDD